MRKEILLGIICIIIFSRVVVAQTGIGIWPGEIQIEAKLFKITKTNVYVFNPSDYDIEAQVVFHCSNCEKNITLFDHSIGILENSWKIETIPKHIIIRRHTIASQPEVITVKIYNPLFVKKYLKFDFLGRDLRIPIYTLHFGKETIKGKIVVTTFRKNIMLSVTSRMLIDYYGINTSIFMFTIALIILAVSIVLYIKWKKVELRI